MDTKTISMAENAATSPTRAAEVYGNNAILDNILRICAQNRRRQDILAVSYSSRQGADLAPKHLYANLTGCEADHHVPRRVSPSLGYRQSGAQMVQIVDPPTD